MQVTEYFAAAPSVTFRRAEGTLAAPTPLTFVGEGLMQLRAQGYNTTTGFAGLPQVAVEVMTAEIPTATGQGTYFQIRTVPIGSLLSKGGLKVDSNQHVAVGDDPFDAETVPYALTQIGSLGFAAVMQPAAIVGGTVNDYNPTDTLGSRTLDTTFDIRQFCSGDVTITGIAGGIGTTSVGTLGGRIILFNNTGTGTCTFTNEDLASAAINRLTLPNSQSFIVAPNGMALFFYDAISLRWKVIANAVSNGSAAAPSLPIGTASNAGLYNNGFGAVISNMGFDIIATSISGTIMSGFTQMLGGMSAFTVQTGGITGPKWSSGLGAPVIACTNGDLFSRTDGGIVTTFYVCTSPNTWTPK